MFETEQSRRDGGAAPIRSPVSDRYVMSTVSSRAKCGLCGSHGRSAHVSDRWGSDSYSFTVGFLVGKVDVTPRRERVITYGVIDYSIGITDECV